MVITELIEKFVLVTVVPVSDLAFSLRVPLVVFMFLVAMKVNFVLGVLVVRIFFSHFCIVGIW